VFKANIFVLIHHFRSLQHKLVFHQDLWKVTNGCLMMQDIRLKHHQPPKEKWHNNDQLVWFEFIHQISEPNILHLG